MTLMQNAVLAARKKMEERQGGAVTLEWVFLFPLMVLIMLAVFWTFAAAISYIYMNGLCNDIAQDMNVGKTGAQIATSAAASLPDNPVKVKSNGTFKSVPVTYRGPAIVKSLGKFYLAEYADPSSLSSKVISASGTDLQGVQSDVDKHKVNRFDAGWMGVDVGKIVVEASLNGSYSFDTSSGRLPSGTKIHVGIQFTVMGLIPITTSGYCMVT